MFNDFFERFRSLWLRVRLAWRLFHDARVPTWTKVVPVLTVLYLLSPLDIIPDFIIGLGQIDDIFILMMGLQLFERIAPRVVVEEHLKALTKR